MALAGWIFSASAAEVEASVVRIVNEYNRFSWYSPWQSGETGKGAGSGFVISKKRIMTNAHVVSDAALLLVYFHNDPQPYPAHVVAVQHECDLAVLELNDPSRMEKVPALSFDGLPALRSRVVTYGYPAGGTLISSTVGIVSRIELQNYVHAGVSSFLAVQTDAAINPGNSGGPVIQDGKVVGVAFQGNGNLENMGFFIPPPIVEHFLNDLEDGELSGFPQIGLLAANMENPAARRYAGVPEGQSGIRIENIFAGSGLDELLNVDDVITSIDGYGVANDGTIDWNGLRLPCFSLSDFKQVGESLTVDLIRKGESRTVQIPLTGYQVGEMRANLYDRKPTYYIYAGMVFVPLNLEVMKTYSDQWVQKAPQELIYEIYFRPLADRIAFDRPRVVQIRRLEHAVNAEEPLFLYRLIESVNGRPVNTLQDLALAIKQNRDDFHVIRFEEVNGITVLNRQEADAAHEEILKKYAIPRDQRL
jgi:S1-C subfamily serine protease